MRISSMPVSYTHLDVYKRQVEYSTGGGSRCCLGPGQINGLELSAGFVNKAFNPLPLSGGCDRETAMEAMDRVGKELKHRFRAVTGSDYVDLAMEAVGNIRCV